MDEMSNWRWEERAVLLHCFLIHLQPSFPYKIATFIPSRKMPSSFVISSLPPPYGFGSVADEATVPVCVSGFILID